MRNLKLLVASICLLGILCLNESCKKDTFDGILPNIDIVSNLKDSTKGEINDYLKQLGHYINPPKEPFSETVKDSITEDSRCTVGVVKYAPEFNELFLIDPMSGLYLANIVDGNSILDGGYRAINGLNLDSITMSLSTIATVNNSSSIKVMPKLSDIRNGINKLLHNVASNSTTATVNFEITEIRSEKAVQSSLGVNFSGWGQKIEGSYKWGSTDKKTKYLVKFLQKYYTIDVDIPRNPSDWFKSVPDFRSWGNKSPVYVSSITYGRAVYFMLESSSNSNEVEAALNAAFKGWGATADISAQTKQKEIIEQSTMKALIVGGSAGEAVKAVNGVEDLKKYIETGGNFSINSPGAPISYTLRFLNDNSIASVVLNSSYTYRNCQPYFVGNKLKVTVKSGSGELRFYNKAFITINYNDGSSSKEYLLQQGLGQDQAVTKEILLDNTVNLYDIASITLKQDGVGIIDPPLRFDGYNNWDLIDLKISLINSEGHQKNIFNSVNETPPNNIPCRFTGEKRLLKVNRQN